MSESKATTPNLGQGTTGPLELTPETQAKLISAGLDRPG
jgi:hypothetical protein